MVRFRPIPMRKFSPGLGRCPTYGLLAEERVADGWRAVAAVSDVSRSGALAQALADRWTRLQLDPLDLPYVLFSDG